MVAQVMSDFTLSSTTIMQLAEASVEQDLLGVMTWFCSVQNGLVYGEDGDCTNSQESMDGYIKAMEFLNQHQ